jgi:hypothetical protein
MYESSLRHIHDPVLSSLKMKGILYFFKCKQYDQSTGGRRKLDVYYGRGENLTALGRGGGRTHIHGTSSHSFCLFNVIIRVWWKMWKSLA